MPPSGAKLECHTHIRSFGSSVRGFHPDLLIFDDVLSDQNSLTQAQRDKTWRRFIHTYVPMHPRRFLILGTTLHADDLFHRLAARRVRASDGRVTTNAVMGQLGFMWQRYQAIIGAETALWPGRHSYAELAILRESEPLMFSREYMNDPRDDDASLFPRQLTDVAVDAGAELTLVPFYRKAPGELVLLGADLGVSGAIGADYTVVLVVAWNKETGTRRLLTARRERGIDYDAMVTLLRDLCRSYGVDYGIVENNGFQQWLLSALAQYPETRVIHGHTTLHHKASFDIGVPILKLPLLHGLWVVPSGDDKALEFARILQAELSAFGFRDGRLEGIGEHDDTVMAMWFIEIAVRNVTELLALNDDGYIYMEDLGIEPVVIGEPY